MLVSAGRSNRESMKTCSTCGETKQRDEFYADNRRPNGRKAACKACCKILYQTSERHKAGIRNAQRRYKKRHPYRHLVRSRMLRDKILDALGHQCVCCGERERAFLAIDHVHGGGNKERTRATDGYHQRVLKEIEDGTDKYQILCHNCNMAKGFYGHCPHELRLGWFYQVLMSQLPEKGAANGSLRSADHKL